MGEGVFPGGGIEVFFACRFLFHFFKIATTILPRSSKNQSDMGGLFLLIQRVSNSRGFQPFEKLLFYLGET